MKIVCLLGVNFNKCIGNVASTIKIFDVLNIPGMVIVMH